LHIEDSLSTKFEIQCHSKGKKNKKKKIPLITGDEVDIDMNQMDSDCPILWIRIDSDLRMLREIKFEQPDYHWQNQLRHEKDIVAQLDSIDMLTKLPSAGTRSSLISVVENSEIFYRVRVQAAFALAEVSNKMAATWNGPLPLVSTFRKLFMNSSSPGIVCVNNFSDLQLYLIQKSLPVAVSRLRNAHNLCPSEIVKFLLELIKYNENSKNQFTDAYYKAALIDALASTVSVSVAVVVDDDTAGPKSASLTPDMRLVIEEIVLRLNLEKLLPTCNFVITCSCLNALRLLQKLGHIPDNMEIFKQYTDYENNFESVRQVAFQIMVECLSVKNDPDLLDYLLEYVERDPSYRIKQHIVSLLCKYPPLKANSEEASLNNEQLVNRLWRMMKYVFFFSFKI
jgi:transcription initiation factor TFIID subunit 2